MATLSRGAFITLEGGEGVGKSTQIRLLAVALESKGYKVRTTREPGGSPGAELIRNLVLTGDVDRWTPMTEALLVTASRAQHVERLVKPQMDEGVIVLSDRFFDSSIAYQGAARGLGMDKVREMQSLALGGFEPDLTLVLDLPVKVGLARAIQREADSGLGEDRFERMGEAFHNTITDAFRAIIEHDPVRCRRINADRTVEEIQQDIWTEVTAFLEAFA